MSEENTKTDDDSVELSTVLQLNTQKGTDQVTVVKRDDGEQALVSLDETYEVTGQESLNILAANCREYLNNKRLHPSGPSVLLISGCESMVPAYDRMNGVMGGESFLEKLKQGFITVVKAAKKFLLAVIDWIITRIRVLLGFEKTERELAIVAAHSEDTKRELIALLSSLIGAEKVNIDVAELYEALPGDLTQRDAFSIVYNRNKKIVDQVDALASIQGRLDKVETLIKNAGHDARTSRGRYQQAVAKLRNAWKDQESFSSADVIEFRAMLDNEVAVKLNPEPIRKELRELVDMAYDIDLGGVGVDKAFKQNLTAQKDVLDKTIPVTISAADFERVKMVAGRMGTVLLNTQQPFDAATLGALKDVIEVADAQLIESIDAVFDKAGILKLSYTSYCSLINEYTWSLNQLISISSNVRKSIANIVNWSTKVDKLMFTYLSKDLKTIINTEEELLNENGNQIAAVYNANGERVDTTSNLNYNQLFMAKHRVLGPALEVYRAKTGDLRKNFKIIERVNAGLKQMGIQSRI
jgi:hypothetical protein